MDRFPKRSKTLIFNTNSQNSRENNKIYFPLFPRETNRVKVNIRIKEKLI
jgi:hypothetical protein